MSSAAIMRTPYWAIRSMAVASRRVMGMVSGVDGQAFWASHSARTCIRETGMRASPIPIWFKRGTLPAFLVQQQAIAAIGALGHADGLVDPSAQLLRRQGSRPARGSSAVTRSRFAFTPGRDCSFIFGGYFFVVRAVLWQGSPLPGATRSFAPLGQDGAAARGERRDPRCPEGFLAAPALSMPTPGCSSGPLNAHRLRTG